MKICNNIILYIYHQYFKLFKINDNQSLKYQIMIILMHLYKMRRFWLIDYCSYVGDSRLIITDVDLKKVDNVIYNFLTYSNKDILKKTNQRPLSFFGAMCHNVKNDYFEVSLKENKEIFNNDDTNESIVFELT